MDDFTHDVQMGLSAIKYVKSDIFAYDKKKGEDANSR